MTYKSYSSGFGSVPNSTPKDNIKPIDKNLQELLYITGQSHNHISAFSSSFGKLALIRQLITEVRNLKLDDASRVKIKIWLDKHKKQLEAE